MNTPVSPLDSPLDSPPSLHAAVSRAAKLTLVLEGAGGVPATQTERERTVLVGHIVLVRGQASRPCTCVSA